MIMNERIDIDFQQRRARPGKGARKAELLKELWQTNNLITQHIIAGQAGNPDAARQRGILEAERLMISIELLNITKD